MPNLKLRPRQEADAWELLLVFRGGLRVGEGVLEHIRLTQETQASSLVNKKHISLLSQDGLVGG